jgi:hypothetical protein
MLSNTALSTVFCQWSASSFYLSGNLHSVPLLFLTFFSDTNLSQEHCCIGMNNFTFVTVAQQHCQRTLLRFYRYNKHSRLHAYKAVTKKNRRLQQETAQKEMLKL